MPRGGFGNLIALPLQKEARLKGNSVFIDEHFHPYEDQWEFLAKIRCLSEEEITVLTSKISPGSELGDLKQDDEEPARPWERRCASRAKLSRQEFPSIVQVVKANMLFIDKSGISQRALNIMKRLAAFKNPEFYRLQAMRQPTYKEPPILSCSEETPEYLCLPRCCDVELETVLKEVDVAIQWADKTYSGKPIKVAFTGVLREDQEIAAEAMLKHDCGVLSAATAFGKTVVAARLIAERKVNTLILTHRQQLLSQWMARLAQFLRIDEELPVMPGKRGRQPMRGIIGQIGAGKDNPNGIIDVGIMQSLTIDHEAKECVRDYGMVIVDECHHISAVSFEQIIKKVRSKYVYGLTATPVRRDGRHPIIFMHCFLSVYQNDMMNSARQTVIVSPFVTNRRVSQMLPDLAVLANRASVVVVTRPADTCKHKDRPVLEATLSSLENAGVRLLFRANIHQKFAVIDQKIVWYGSINLLSYGAAQESIMRLESTNIAQELMKDLGKYIKDHDHPGQ